MAHGNFAPGMHRTRSTIAGFCALAWLAGCASYQPAPLSAAQNAQAIEARTLTDSRLEAFIAAAGDAEHPAPAGSTPQIAWDVTSLTLAALYYHPDLDIARARSAAARSDVVTAQQIPNPSLSFEDLSYAPRGAGPAQWTIAPVINFLIETAGKRSLRTSEARALAAAARADLSGASWQVRGGVRDALLALWAAQSRLSLLRQRLTLSDQLATLLEHRFAAGEASSLDVARERTHRNEASLAARDAEREAGLARAQLAAAIGIPLRALDGIEISFGMFDQPLSLGDESASGELRRVALTQRSDVQGLLAQYAAAESALALETAYQYPNLTLSPGYSFDSTQNRYLLLPAVELPLFNHNQGRIAESLARREEAAARFTALQTRIIDAIDGATLAYRVSASSMQTADALLAGEKDREQRTLRSFQAGAIDRPTLLAVQLERLAAEQARLEVLLQAQRAVGTLEDALQHSFFGPALTPSLEQNPRLAGSPAPR